MLENWNECNEEEKLEELNIEKQPQQRPIKITTKKILKKTNYIYKKFENKNLNVIHNELNIEGKHKIINTEFTSENSKINININKSYESKKNLDENNLCVSQANEIFINSNNYKKKEIKITTKTSLTRTKFIHKKFKNIYISNENQIFIKRQKNKNINNTNIIPLEQNESEKLQNPLKEFVEEGIQKEEKIEKEEKTTDTLDLEKKEIKITTKKVVKKTNILHKFDKNLICENSQLIINKTPKEKVKDIKLHSKNNKKPNKNNQLKTVVLYIDKKFDLQNCFNKWNTSTINVPLKNDLKNKNQAKSNLILNNSETISDNKKTTETSNYDTINIDEKKIDNKKDKSNNNETKEGKKRKIKIKYIKNNKDNSLNTSKSSENKISINDESIISKDANENKTIKYTHINEIEEENKEMKSLEPKSTRKPFILRINKVEVKKKILKSNSRSPKKDTNDLKNNNIMNLFNIMIIKYYFDKWRKNLDNENNTMKKLVGKFIIRSLAMNKKLFKFKTHLIKYALKNK